MITKGDKIIFGVIALLIIVTFIFWKDARSLIGDKPEVKELFAGDKKGQKKDKKNNDENLAKVDSEVRVTQKWDLPVVLKEISGIAFVSDNLIACVQDEAGKIFIFNTASNLIEKEIPFGAAGDYEGIAIVGSTAYVLRADGKLFEVIDYNTDKLSVVQHTTHLTAKQNVEGLCYDKKNNRLLLAIKGKEATSNDYKGIYAFDLSSKKLATKPAHKIDLTHSIWNEVKGKNKMEPSDLDVHPVTGDLYIIDGASPKLLVMSADGTQKSIYRLNTSEFHQPEGIAFTQSGELFISNEGRSGSGNILKVSVRTNL